MSEQPMLVEKPHLPAVHSAAPPRLKQGATEAFSVAQWKHEALEFQQRLDSLLLRGRPAAALAAAVDGEASNMSDAAAARDAHRWEAALATLEAAAPPLVLDASDLRLLTVQEELVRELGAEPAQQSQQAAQQQQEEGRQQQEVPLLQEQQEQQEAERLALQAPPPPPPQHQQQAGEQAGPARSEGGTQDGPAQGAAAAPVQPADGRPPVAGLSVPPAEPSAAPCEATLLPLAAEASLLGLPGRHVPLVQAVPWAGHPSASPAPPGTVGTAPAAQAEATQEGPAARRPERQDQQQQLVDARGSLQQGPGQQPAELEGAEEQQQAALPPQRGQQSQPIKGVVAQRKGGQELRPARAPAVGGEQQPASGMQQEAQAEPGGQDRHVGPPEQQAAPREGGAAAADEQALQGEAQPAAGSQQRSQQQDRQRDQQQDVQQAALQVGLPGLLPLPGLQLPLLPLPLLPAFPLDAIQLLQQQQPVQQQRGARQRQLQEQQVEPGGRRHRKRPRWLADMVDVAAAEQMAEHPEQAGGAPLPPPLPPLPEQPAQQPAAPALQLPVTSLEAAAAFGLPAEPAVPGWDAALAALFGQGQGQQALPVLPWPQLGELLQLPLVPVPAAEAGAAEEETEVAEAAGGVDGAADQSMGGWRGGGGGGGRRHGGGRRRAKGKARARPGAVERPAFVEAAIQAAIEVKEEGDAALEAYRQRAEAARQRRLDQRAAAAQLLASIADSELVAPLQWQLLQDARSRQLQMVARAAAEAALLEEAQAGGGTPVERVGSGEVVLQVALHVPQAPQFVSQEWLVLGSQRLTELRDILFCVADDNIAAVEKEENAHLARNGQPVLKLRKPSAYFYIEGTFYNDLRHPQAEDYSAPIRQYNREEGIPAPPHPLPGSARTDVTTTEFTAAKMQDATFDSLWLRLGSGAGYLYCHQGGCEHLLTFQDVRLYDPSCDPPLRQHYPFRLTAPQHTIIRDCEVCGTRTAKRVTYDDRAAPHTPFFWCEECFRLMHYNQQGAALYTDFRVFPYVQEYPLSIMATKQKSGGARTRAATAAVAATEQG